MKRLLALCVLVAAALAAPVLDRSAQGALPASAAPDPWTLTVATDVRYFSWDSTRGFPTRASAPSPPGRGFTK